MSETEQTFHWPDTTFRFLAEYTLSYSDKVESLFFNDFESIQKWLIKNEYIQSYSIFKFTNNQKVWMLSDQRTPTQVKAGSVK